MRGSSLPLLVEPDVRISRIRLTDSLSMLGTRKELTPSAVLQVLEPIAL
jgi:hypothetical protein